jgi:methylated-DNA-protein-cysteine methyltransferase-like protein
VLREVERVEPRVVGPGFHAKVYALVRRVPRGRVVTYGQIAATLGSSRVARQVGYALAAAGQASEPVPWHRVVNAKGEVSRGKHPTDADEQRELLEREGVQFSVEGTVDLEHYRWHFER